MDAIEQFLQYLEFEKRYSKLTIRSYNNDLFQFLTFVQSTFDVSDLLCLQHNQIRSWLSSLKSENEISSASINRKISALKSFYKYHLKIGNISSLPTTKIISPKKSKRLPAFANETQMNKLLDEVEFGTTFKDFTDKLIIDILYSTGMRRSELLGLQKTDIDFFNGQVKVLGKGRKERFIPLLPEVAEQIQHYLALRKELQLETETALLVKESGTPLYEKYIYLVAKKYLSMVSAQEKKSPHTLRHSFATHLLNHGAELNAVKELLGHSSLAATQIYTHNSIEKLKNTFKKAHPKA